MFYQISVKFLSDLVIAWLPYGIKWGAARREG
jgi:hypothetical protein